MKNNLAPYEAESFYAIIVCMEGGENLNTNINNDNTDFEAANGWESLMYDESESMATFAAHALQKAKAKDRIEQDRKHSEPKTPYGQQRKRIEQSLGHIGTSILDLRDKTTDRQAIRQELRDYGVDRDELDDIDYPYERILSPEQIFEKFNGLFAFLGEDTKGNPNIVEEYQQITDKKEQLRFILSSSLSDKVRLFCSENFDYPNYDNFMHKLQFQQDFINGTAKVWRRDWDWHKGEYIDVQKTLDPSSANPKNIALDLKRNALYSAMIGSPELASVKIATAKINDSKPEEGVIGEVVCLHGFESGIDKWDNGSIGQWADLCDEYKIVFDKINSVYKDDSPEQKEYKAVRELANWITGAYIYNGQKIRDSESPSCADFKEAIVAGRLSNEVMRRFRGMRRKILYSDLHNIERFIGKSGYSHKRSSFESERSRLSHRIDYINSLSDDDKQKFLAKENTFEIKKQEEWREKEVERIRHKYEKLISKTRSEERRATYTSRQEEEIQRVMADVSGRIEYFESRTLDGLFSDINERRELLSRRIEKRKSLAEKAIDLHFALLPKYEDDDNYDHDYDEPRIVPFEVRTNIDWINEAPFGLIRKVHRLLGSGLSQQELIIEAHKTSMDEASFSKWAIDEVAQRMIDGSGGREQFDMAGASHFLKEVLGDNFRYEADTSEIGHKLAQNLYTFLPVIESDRDTIPVPQEFFSSDEMTESAIQHLRALTDLSLVDDGLPYRNNYDDRWSESGIAERLIDDFILPNQPDFFQHSENKVAILRMLRQSAFHVYSASQFQDIISISEKYLPNEYTEQIQQLREIRDKLKQIEPEPGSSRYGRSWHERQLYEDAIGIFAQIADYDGVDFPDPAKIIQLVENGVDSEDLSRSLGNGFSIEEIVQYPFLCSKLLKESK